MNQKVKGLILLNKRLFYKMNRRFVIVFPAIFYGYHKKENKYFAWAQFKIKCNQYKPCLWRGASKQFSMSNRQSIYMFKESSADLN